MKNKLLLLATLILSTIILTNLTSAILCMGSNGYYQDCGYINNYHSTPRTIYLQGNYHNYYNSDYYYDYYNDYYDFDYYYQGNNRRNTIYLSLSSPYYSDYYRTYNYPNYYSDYNSYPYYGYNKYSTNPFANRGRTGGTYGGGYYNYGLGYYGW